MDHADDNWTLVRYRIQLDDHHLGRLALARLEAI